MSSLRLLLVTDAVGGVWVYSLELARALRPLGIETVLTVMGPPPSEEQRCEASGLELIETGLPLEWLDTSASEIRRAGDLLAAIAERQRADIIQTSSAALLADTQFGRPTVAVQHSCIASWWAAVKGTRLPAAFAWRAALVRAGLERACAIVAPSNAFAAETARIYGVEVEVVHNGRSPATSREIPQGEFVFTAGRLWDEGKNAATLEAAAARLAVPFQAAGPVVGPNGARIALHHMNALGPLGESRLAGLYAARPIYASAALYEPFGLSLLEAAQAGCALLLSDIPTHREMWNGAATFFPPHDEAAVARAVRDLLHDRQERQQLGELARARAAHFTPRRMARAMAAIYARVADRATSMQVAGAA